MNFLWPEMLWLLLLVPAAVIAYLLALRRKKKLALRYASLNIVKEAMAGGPSVRRHIPPLLFLCGLTAMLIAVARPTAMMTLPSAHETVILALDVSISMRAEDVEPSRIAAAQAAVRKFVDRQPRNARVGVVAFAGTASVVQPPTVNREDVLAAIDQLQLQRATAIGSGILVSLKTIIPDIEFDLHSSNPRIDGTNGSQGASESRRGAQGAVPLDQAPGSRLRPFEPVAPGSYGSAAIILLTDGLATTGPDPIESARMAAERGVRVFTVGIGTSKGEIMGAEGWSMRVRLDEDTLKKIAQVTHGEYFYAGSADDLAKVYETLNSRLVFEKRTTEIGALFAAAAAVFSVAAAVLSMLWFNRIL